MKFFIAFTLFAVASALPRPHAVDVEDEASPIVFRHWEPTPDLRIRPHLPNKGVGDLNIIKELISQLANSSEASNDPNDILNALQFIHEILNHKGGNDDDNEAGLPTIGRPDVGSEVDSSNNDEPDDESESDSPVNGGGDDGQAALLPINDESSADVINPEDELVSSRRLVDFMPRPVQLVPRPTPEGIAFVESPVGGLV